MRSLAERVAAARSERPALDRAPRRGAGDRAARLARWLGARLVVEPDGAAVVVERRAPLPEAARLLLSTMSEGVYFDTETTGLSTGAGTVIFLAGMARLEGSDLVVRQVLLPDYQHERPMLRLVAAELGVRPRCVTYNGRGFDIPMLTARLTVHGLFAEQASLPERHDDLLPLARRLFRRSLGGARLADVERGVLGVHRRSDCPGSEVPSRYFAYLRSGSADVLADVLDHNFQDVVSLALLEAEILRLRTGGWRQAPVLDARGMAVDLLRAGATSDAVELLEQALVGDVDPVEAGRTRRMATRLLLAAGEIDRAEELWRCGTRRASVEAASAWIEVARIRERHRGDLRGALEAANAASRVLDLAFALGRGGSLSAIGRTRIQVEGRLRRLRRWTAAAERRRASA